MRRMLLTLGLVLGFVASAAAPAGALTFKDQKTVTLYAGGPGSPSVAFGTTTLYYDGAAPAGLVVNQNQIRKDHGNGAVDGYRCIEVWSQPHSATFRPPDLMVQCRTGFTGANWNGTSALHYLDIFGNPGAAVIAGNMLEAKTSISVCYMDPSNGWLRRNGIECYSQGTVIDLSQYTGRSWQNIASWNSGYRPEHKSWNSLDILPQCQGAASYMHGGDVMVPWNGGYWAIMQDDGNFVVYNYSGQWLWQSGTSGHPGSTAVMQNDGNFVIYDAGGTPRFATNTFFGCYGQLRFDNDGHLRVLNGGGGVVWTS